MKSSAPVLVFACTAVCALLLVGTAVAVAQPAGVSLAQPTFQFQLGFKTLADLIPDTAGEPVEAEHPGPNEDILQRTTTGIMVWRSLDNWTGFTDGSRTWINGPSGVAERANNERFDWESKPPLTFDDPIAYCAAVGTIDRTDSHYTGPLVPEVVRRGLGVALGIPNPFFPERGIFLRCADGELLACTVGANLNCGQADTSTTPNPGMVEYCQNNPESPFIPLAVVGHSGIYAWQCRQGAPEIERQVFHVDPRGFVEEFWHEIPPLTTPR